MQKLLIFIGLFLVCSCSLHLLANDQSLIQEINKANTTWTAGESERFIDFSMESVKGLMGAFKTPKAESKKLRKKIKARLDLPERFDLREQYPKCESLKEIRDQGSCGSCWAFSTSEAMTDRICIHSKQTLQTRISALQLVSCCTACGNGCFGGWPANAFSYWVKSGLPTGGLYGDKATCKPYVFPPCEHHQIPGPHPPCDKQYRPTPKCTSTCIPEYPKALKEDLRFGASYYTIARNEAKIMTEIYENGSVSADFTVYEDFIVYKSGVYQHVKGSRLGGHAIKIIGWGVEKGVKYWQCINSWNDNWGEKGTFKFLRGKNHLGIEGDIVGGIPKFNAEELSFIE